MLKFYHTPISLNSRRVWVMLLEKQLEFEEVILNLDGDQFDPDFTAVNPFQRIPVLVDGDQTLVESLAILDYLEAKYPTPCFLPEKPEDLPMMRMLELVIVNELQPALLPFVKHMAGLPESPSEPLAKAQEKIYTILDFYQHYLGDRPYLLGEQITLADIVAGTALSSLLNLKMDLGNYPTIQDWLQRLIERESWKKIEITPEYLQAMIPRIHARYSQRS